jgi:hypothetical protein
MRSMDQSVGIVCGFDGMSQVGLSRYVVGWLGEVFNH